jgi:hypothetical protein
MREISPVEKATRKDSTSSVRSLEVFAAQIEVYHSSTA